MLIPFIAQLMVIHITSTTDSSFLGADYIVILQDESMKHARKLSSSSGTKTLTYRDAFQPIISSLYAAAHVLVYEWEDSDTSDKGLILIRFSYNTTDFTVHEATSLDVNINGFLSMTFDDDVWFSIIWKEDDGTLSLAQLNITGFSPNNYVKLKMPVYQEIWSLIFNAGGPSLDYLLYVDNNKFTVVMQSWSKHPDWCEDYDSEQVNATTLNATSFTLSWISQSLLDQDSVTNDLKAIDERFSDTSTTSTQGNLAEVQCARMRSDQENFYLNSATVNKNSSGTALSVKWYFNDYYNYTCPLNTSNGVDFNNPELNSTVKFENGTTATWASADNDTGKLVLGNVSVNTYDDFTRLVISAYNSDGLDAIGYVNVTIVNLPPYNNTGLTNFTIVAGGSNQTYNVSDLFSDHENETFTLTSDTSNSN